MNKVSKKYDEVFKKMNIKPVVNNIDSKEDIIVRKLDIVKAGWSVNCVSRDWRKFQNN